MEVRSETGIMSSREPFTVNLQSNPSQTQPNMPNMRLTFGPDGTAIYKQVSSASPPPPPPTSYQVGGGGGGSGGAGSGVGGSSGGANDGGVAQPIAASHGLNMDMVDQMKRKRGRPRKYGPDGAMALAISPVLSGSGPLNASTTTAAGGFSSPMGTLNPATSPPASTGGATVKKARGRPPGTGRKHQMAGLGSVGTGFTPHIITVKAGEDVSSMIMSFLQHGPRAVCILSANGAISNVTLRQPAMSGGTVTYEGRFEILSLSGSFLLSECAGQRSRTGGLSVSLAGPDGRVLGGGVAGILTAASPVQVVVGSFFADGKKEPKRQTSMEPTSISKFPPVTTTEGTGSPISRGTLSESSGGGPGSPLNQSTGVSNGAQQGLPNVPWK